MNATTSETDFAVPTGDFVAEWLEENELSQAELARRMGVSAKHVSKLIAGASLSADVATQLELVTGVPARIWLGHEAVYRADVARLGLTASLANEKDLAAAFPLKHLRKLGIVQATLAKPGNAVMELFAFFGVGSVEALRGAVRRQSVAFRQGTAHPVNEYALATWLRLCEMEAATAANPLPPFERDALIEILPQIRELSATLSPNFGQQLIDLLEKVGVRLLYVPEVTGARVHGATRWMNGEPVIALTIRGLTDGQFWFTLFHEIGHVLLHKDGNTHIRPVDDAGSVDLAETEANAFADQTLIPPSAVPKLRLLRTPQDVQRFASDIGVGPGVVVGRLWHDKIWEYTRGHGLSKRLQFEDEG